MASKSSALRDLRMSTAMSSMTLNRTRSILAPSTSTSISRKRVRKDSKLQEELDKKENSKSFTAAPQRTLNLVTPNTNRDWLKKADEIIKSKPKETKKVRKKRLWLQRKSQQKSGLKDKTEQKQRYIGDWAFLPDIALELIFQYLPFEQKTKMGAVCQNWARNMAFCSVWSDLVVHDTFCSRSRYNYAGKFYEDVLDHQEASEALHELSYKIKRLSFLPQMSLHNICAFQELMTKFCDYYGELYNIQAFCYVFPCDFARKHNEVDIFGTGGTILEGMKSLLMKLPGLKKVELVDLQLDIVDAVHVLDEVSEACAERVSTLKLINVSRQPFEMLAISGFTNLKVLCISPANLGDALVECCGDMKRLRNIQIITNKYTESVAPPVDYRIWKAVRKVNPRLRVHLITEGGHRNEIVFQQRAPVKSIIYDSPYTPASTLAINIAVDLYKTDLECYAHKQLPRFKMPKRFDDRPDSAYLYLVRSCPYIHTLYIRERISSATVLLLAYTGKNLRYFHVRRNAIILKCEWRQNPEWTDEFYDWLRQNSRSYEAMEREISQILGFRWYALNDKQYKLTPLNVNIPYYYEGFDEADQYV